MGADPFVDHLGELASRARHPAMVLEYFLDEPIETAETAEPLNDDISLVAAGISPERIRDATLRRAGIVWAANHVIDRCLEDLTRGTWDEHSGVAASDAADDDSGLGEDRFLSEHFPPRFAQHYARGFLAKVLVTAVKVAQDLADPNGDAAACTAEELIRNAICELAAIAWDLAELSPPWMSPTEYLLEDTDFDYLFQEDMDGIEEDPARQQALTLEAPPIADWFTPFNEHRIVHPWVETSESRPRANTLNRLTADDDVFQMVRSTDVVDAPEPIAGLDAISDAVGRYRLEVTAGIGDTWIPDSRDPETSYAQLDRLVLEQGTSGWLTWQPNEGSDHIREDSVIVFRPHRHFPAGPDQPWAEASFGAAVNYVPLSAIVAFRADPAVYRRWNDAWSDVLGSGGDEDA